MDTKPTIRILWIDDRERVSGKPEERLPPPYSDWFEVVHPASTAVTAMSYDSASVFSRGFGSFWFDGDTRFFPAEIIAADYNLKKSAAATGGSKPQRSLRSGAMGGGDHIEKGGNVRNKRDVNFDGLLIGVFYATLTYRHPAALVSITNYLGEMPSEVDTLRQVVSPFLSIATQQDAKPSPLGTRVWKNLGTTERSWAKIIDAAVPELQTRLAHLYKMGTIVISPSDLLALAQTADHDVLTVRSPFGTRRLPVHGLFCNLRGTADRDQQIQGWARDLLRHRITSEHLARATTLADCVWEAYNNDVRMDEHSQFSLQHYQQLINTTEYKRLCDIFKPEQKRTRIAGGSRMECSSNWASIKMGSYSNEERRWAALFLIRRLLKRILLFMRNVGIATTVDGQINDIQELHPDIRKEDILLLLFPYPDAPFPVPWHISNSRQRGLAETTWTKWIEDKLQFTLPEIISGVGLTDGERQVLQGLVIDEDEEFGEDEDIDSRFNVWRSFGPARLFLFGAQPCSLAGASG